MCGTAVGTAPPCHISYEDRGALRGTPGSAYLQPEPNATELPSSAPSRPELVELQASAPSLTPLRAEEHIATTPNCRPRAPAPSPTLTRTVHLFGLQIVRPRALARRRAPKGTSHYTCWCERGTLHVILLGVLTTWVPVTAMLPLPLAPLLSLTSSWQQHHCLLSAP